MPRRLAALLLALVNLVGAAVLAFFGMLADGLRCDDNCSIAPGWRNDPRAWQWHGSLVLCLVILASAFVLVAAVMIRRTHLLQSVAVGVQLAAVSLVVLIWSTANDRQGGFATLVLIFGFFVSTGAAAAISASD